MSSILSTVLLQRDEMSLHGELRKVIFGENLEMKIVWMQQRDLIASQKRDMRFGTKSGSCGAASAKVVKQLFLPKTRNNFKMIDKSRHWSLLLYLESKAINRYKPTLNHGTKASKDLLIFNYYIMFLH